MKKTKHFLTAFTVSLCVLGLGAGLFAVGYNTRRMTEGQSAPTATYRLESGRLLLKNRSGQVLTVPAPQEERVRTAAVPAPVRLSLHLLRRLTAAAESLAALAGEY